MPPRQGHARRGGPVSTSKPVGNRKVIHAICLVHGGCTGFTNLVVTKRVLRRSTRFPANGASLMSARIRPPRGFARPMARAGGDRIGRDNAVVGSVFRQAVRTVCGDQGGVVADPGETFPRQPVAWHRAPRPAMAPTTAFPMW
jgi:hypothetical protein